MSSMNMFKAINPLDYLGPEVEIRTTTNIKRSNPDPSDPNYYYWDSQAGTRTIAHEYTANRVVLMDNLRITEETTVQHVGGSSSTGTFNYTVYLLGSDKQILNKYCRFQFSFKFNGSGLAELRVNINVGTIWCSGTKTIQLYGRNLTSGTKVSPLIDVDWSDPSTIVRTI